MLELKDSAYICKHYLAKKLTTKMTNMLNVIILTILDSTGAIDNILIR